MAKVVVIFNGQVQKEVNIDRARMNIGRRPGNDLVLDHLAVSGRHAAIDTTSEGTFILDLGSTNGTAVNGQPIKKHQLQNDDVVEVGKYQLKFVVEVDNYQISPDETLKVGKIKVLNGGNSGKEMVLSKPVTTLGSPGILVVSIARDGNRFKITFVEGKVFPKINGETIDARPRVLEHGDEIDLSGTKMEFQLN
ncbi:FHA domain-containing protein [bacterium]|jgi:ribosome-associated protein YbcJ (S4-like RNA binding protein)|uniref:FHA domain-containing protein n=1 Tax=Undibacterium seohonense TaxID=1344950 RepID=A0ABR6X4I0_9BURK|nr:FHA domain-containing protein [Undibacterium seohonense]MBC3807804.1 FHA domain-containing protein [Undibacterium seohonense]MBY0386368.1 FHA domain-containing protein [bacterium]